MRLIESVFPLVEVNALAEHEMSFKLAPGRVTEALRDVIGVKDAKADPSIKIKINSLFYYPARIPTSATRFVTLASLIDKDIGVEGLLRACGMDEIKKIAMGKKKFLPLFMINPRLDLVEKLLNRKPSEYIVIDPMAGGGSIPLEAKRLGFTIIAGDYNPVSYLLLRASIEFPSKHGTRLYELVNEEAKKLIEYVRRELGRFYPSEKRGSHIFALSVEHECGAAIPLIKETALHKEKSIYVSWEIDKDRKRLWFRISSSPPPLLRICPFCGKPVSIDLLRKRWVERHKEILERLLRGDESAAEEIPKYYCLIAVSMSPTKYRGPTQQDEKLLVEASRELARIAKEENVMEYLPVFPIPNNNNVFRNVREQGLEYWHQLFTPRQLLVLYKVAKHLRERAEALRKALGELGVAVALYLALGFAKALNYNSLLVQWHSSRGVVGALVGSHYALAREAELGYDFVEGNPTFSLGWAFEPEEEGFEEEEYSIEATSGGLLPVLRVLCKSLGGLWYEGRDAIYLWDARELDKHLPPASVDLVNVDPPYYDQHDYAGITEFFWVLLQTMLLPVLDDLFPKDRIKIKWDRYSPEIPKDIEMHGKPPLQPGSTSSFGASFASFLKASSKILKPDGLLVVWYAYGKLAGWEELFYRFYEAGYTVTKTWQVWTQSPQRRVALHTKAFFTSMVIVARPAARRQTVLDAEDPKLVKEVSQRVSKSLQFMLNTYGLEHLNEALVVSMADGIAGATVFEIPSDNPLMYIGGFRALLNSSLKITINTVLKDLMAIGYPKPLELDPISRLYVMLLIASHRDQKKGLLRVSYDFANRISQVIRGGSLHLVMSQGGSRESDVLLSPEDMARRNYVVSEALKLLYDICERLPRDGARATEEYARDHSTHAPLALAIAVLAWDKLGVNNININKEQVINILRKASM